MERHATPLFMSQFYKNGGHVWKERAHETIIIIIFKNTR